IRTTARASFRRQNAYVSRNREPLRGEDAITAINGAAGNPAPYLIRSSLGRVLGIFDSELAKLGADIETQGLEFDPDKFLHHRRQSQSSTKTPEANLPPPVFGDVRPSMADDDDGGGSFVIMDFSYQ
ncbi:MAG: hypothetical protein ACK4UN_02355, partial [Limisphaerales bacterium]